MRLPNRPFDRLLRLSLRCALIFAIYVSILHAGEAAFGRLVKKYLHINSCPIPEHGYSNFGKLSNPSVNNREQKEKNSCLVSRFAFVRKWEKKENHYQLVNILCTFCRTPGYFLTLTVENCGDHCSPPRNWATQCLYNIHSICMCPLSPGRGMESISFCIFLKKLHL